MAEERRDWFSDPCYTGNQQRLVSPEAFRKQFCAICRNAACTTSAVSQSLWQTRMDTQVDRLLVHPKFGDPKDPQFAPLAATDFPDMLREALAIEIASNKGDWAPVSDAEITAAMSSLPKPVGFQPEPDPEPQPIILWDGQAKGTGGAIYRVTLVRFGVEEVWSCTCPAFQYRRVGKEGCKHIQEAAAVRLQTEPPAPPPPPTPVKPPNPNPASATQWQQAMDRRAVPRTRNTPFPSRGMMIDGSPPDSPGSNPPARDPWAPPAPTIPVGGKVVLGGGPKKKDP